MNSDLIGKFINLASRAAVLLPSALAENLQKELRLIGPEAAMFRLVCSSKEMDDAGFYGINPPYPNIAKLYEQRNYAHALRQIMYLADIVNKYVDCRKPWKKLAKEEENHDSLHEICTVILNAFKRLTVSLPEASTAKTGSGC